MFHSPCLRVASANLLIRLEALFPRRTANRTPQALPQLEMPNGLVKSKGRCRRPPTTGRLSNALHLDNFLRRRLRSDSSIRARVEPALANARVSQKRHHTSLNRSHPAIRLRIQLALASARFPDVMQRRHHTSLITPRVEERLVAITQNYASAMERLTTDAATISTEDRTRLYKELSSLENAAEAVKEYQRIKESLNDVIALLNDSSTDAEMRSLFDEEQKDLRAALLETEKKVIKALLPSDPNDDGNAIMEIRAGIGGDEAGLFAADLMRMYERLGMQYGWKFQVMSINTGVEAINGVKEAIIKITGEQVYGTLKYETGTHRVQRVPATDSQGRVHTSTATIVIMPQIQEHTVVVNPSDLRIDVFRAGGAGGQHVNTTESAVRITHLPTGITVSMQDERSQLQNRKKAMEIIVSRVVEADRVKRANERRDFRRKLIGTGDRSEKIRTYNYAQSRVTDHRIGLTVHNLEKFMAGETVMEMIDGLRMEAEVEALADIQ